MQSVAYYSDLSDRTNNFAKDDVFLHVNCAGHAVYPYRPEGHSTRLDYYLIHLNLGEILFYHPQLTRNMQSGDCLIIEANTPFHYIALSDSVDYYWVHFTGSCVKTILEKCHITTNTVLEVGRSDALSDGFLALFLAFIEQDTFYETSLASALLSLLLTFGRALEKHTGKNSHASAIVASSTAYIHEHLASPLTIAHLASLEYLSPGRYREIFRQVIGMSPQEYILRLRINVACDLLRNTNASIAEIAAQVGCPDVRYFSRLFGKRIGTTPSAYRKNKRSEQQDDKS